MIELEGDTLEFTFPEVHPLARFTITLQRTLRLPEDEKTYPLPPGLGRFPMRHLDDFGDRLPAASSAKGGVIVPMYQSEALWINFESNEINGHEVPYPFALQIAAGKIDAVSGEAWGDQLATSPQSYLVVPKQPWLDGFCVGKGVIRQFVAMPLGSGFTAEEQITGAAEHGGLQISVFPMQREEFERRFPRIEPRGVRRLRKGMPASACYDLALHAHMDMGLAPGGRMRQEIARDPYGLRVWDTEHRSRCFIHLLDSLTWREVTGENPPHPPITAAEYARHGLPWFEYYDKEINALSGGQKLKGLKPTSKTAKEKSLVKPFMPEVAEIPSVVGLHPKSAKVVREGTF